MARKSTGKTAPKKAASSRARTGDQDAALSLERIVATAVDILDAKGVDGLTMRGLADRLGSGVMSLYWHVENKDEVLGLALDSVLAYRPPQESGHVDWHEAIIHLLEDWRAGMLRHPWSASLVARQVLGSNILSRLELLSRRLSDAGVPDTDLNAAIWSLWNYLMGATTTRAGFDLSDAERAEAQQQLETISEHYPAIERSRLLLDDDWDGAFRKGIVFLLDGLAPAKTSPRKRL